jgi:hypothetical protein
MALGDLDGVEGGHLGRIYKGKDKLQGGIRPMTVKSQLKKRIVSCSVASQRPGGRDEVMNNNDASFCSRHASFSNYTCLIFNINNAK